MGCFLLVRHGDTNWNLTLEKNMKGLQQDFVPLTETGENQAKTAAERDEFRDADIILSSPYTRALQTAAIINMKLGLPLRVEFDLHETLPDRERKAHTVETTLQYCADFEKHRGEYPEGEVRSWESLSQARERVLPVLQKYSGFHKPIIVCHEKVIKSLVGWREVPHCSIIPYRLPEGR